MEKYMAIDLKEGKAVRLSKGLMDSAKIYSNEPSQLTHLSLLQQKRRSKI